MAKIKLQIKNRWKPIPDYEDRYVVDIESGDVFSLISYKTLNPFLTNRGYKAVHLSKNGRKIIRTSHSIVYEVVYGKVPCGYEIDHIDGNKLNNHYQNLRACTSSENKQNPNTSSRRPLSWNRKAILAIDKEGKQVGCFRSIRECARELNIERRSIYRCLQGIYHGNLSEINGIHFFIDKQSAIDY